MVSDQPRILTYSRFMAVWLVAEDRVQIVRADSVISFAVVPVKPSGVESADPVARLPSYGRVRILAATSSPRNIDASPWSSLITFDANRDAAVRILADLTVTIARAEEQLARNPGGSRVLFVHGPLPQLNGNPAQEQVWHISEELPVKGWPTSGSYFTDQTDVPGDLGSSGVARSRTYLSNAVSSMNSVKFAGIECSPR